MAGLEVNARLGKHGAAPLDATVLKVEDFCSLRVGGRAHLPALSAVWLAEERVVSVHERVSREGLLRLANVHSPSAPARVDWMGKPMTDPEFSNLCREQSYQVRR